MGIHNKLAEVFGPPGYVTLRQSLFNLSDDEGYVKKSDVATVVREQLGISAAEITDKVLDVYLNLQIKIKKNELHVGTLMSSLRPALQPAVKKLVIQAFNRMMPVNGQIQLGAWMQHITDPQLQDVLITAFGGQDVDPALVAETPVTEAIFLDLISDLAPLTDLDALLLAN